MENTQIVDKKNESKEPKKNNKVLRVLKIVGSVIFYTVIVLLFFYSIMNINAGGKGGIPNLFGKGYLSVQSDSMKASQTTLPEEYKNYKVKSFQKGDLVNVDMLSKGQKLNLKTGDVITFWDNSLKAYNTHRIVYVTYDKKFVDKKTKAEYELTDDDKTTYPLLNGPVYDATKGKTVYNADENIEVNYDEYIANFLSDKNLKVVYTLTSCSTQGDMSVSNSGKYNPGITTQENIIKCHELDERGDIDTFDAGSALIKAKVTSVSKGAGKTIDFIQKNWFLIFVIPVIILLLIELFFVVKNFIDYRNAKNASKAPAAAAIDLEAEKERMRQELLAELKAQQQAESKTEEPVEEVKADEVMEEKKDEDFQNKLDEYDQKLEEETSKIENKEEE